MTPQEAIDAAVAWLVSSDVDRAPGVGWLVMSDPVAFAYARAAVEKVAVCTGRDVCMYRAAVRVADAWRLGPRTLHVVTRSAPRSRVLAGARVDACWPEPEEIGGELGRELAVRRVASRHPATR